MPSNSGQAQDGGGDEDLDNGGWVANDGEDKGEVELSSRRACPLVWVGVRRWIEGSRATLDLNEVILFLFKSIPLINGKYEIVLDCSWWIMLDIQTLLLTF